MFFIPETVAFIQLLIYQSQSIPTSNEQMMKTKLRMFANYQILRKPTCIKKLVRLTEI